MNSHGFWKNILDKRVIQDLYDLCLEIFENDQDKKTYYSDIDLSSKLINKDIEKKVENLLKTRKIQLMATELHIQTPKCERIPHHQDNFYHCTQFDKSLKVLIPLNELNSDNGGLIFLNTDISIPVQKHVASKVLNFSSFIPISQINKLSASETSYEYEIGDASHHFINSIHFSSGNKTNSLSMFIVMRFNTFDYYIDKEAKLKYENCYKEHLLNIKK